MTALTPAAPANRLLALLPASVAASCEPIELEFAAALCESGEPIEHVYFPVDSFISLITMLDDRHQLEVGMVGDEGLFDVSLLLGAKVAAHRAVVQGAGLALRMSAAIFTRHLNKNLKFEQALHRYVCVLLRQLALTAACSHYHDTPARLARWLLLTRDRAHADQFRLTHEFLAYMLGVRRVGITEAATALQKRGLIAYQRGQIVILDSAGLQKAACSCYQQVTHLYDQAMTMPRHRSLRVGLQ